jgi:putative transposase
VKIKLSAHGAWRHQYHIVWIPKYRKEILIRGVKTYVERGIDEIEEYHPEVEVKQYNIQTDHVHLVIEIPPKYSVATIVGKIKQNSSRKIRKRFAWLDKVYKPGIFWSPGYFSSTVGLNEAQIRRYVQYQEKVDKEQLQMELFKL